MFVHGLLDVPLWGTKPSFLPWLLIALAIAIGLQVRAEIAMQKILRLPPISQVYDTPPLAFSVDC